MSVTWNHPTKKLKSSFGIFFSPVGEDGQVKIWSRSGMLRSTLVQAGGNLNTSQNPVFHKKSLTMLLNIKDACELVTYQTCTLQKCQSLFFMRGARVGQWWQHSSPINMALAWILALRPFVGWISCWFSPLLREVFRRVLRFSPFS